MGIRRHEDLITCIEILQGLLEKGLDQAEKELVLNLIERYEHELSQNMEVH